MTATLPPDLAAVVDAIAPLDESAAAAAAARLDRLTKPPGSLGRLEELAITIAAITGNPAARVDRPAIVVAAADHGVASRGVSAYPPEVTAEMVANFVAGGAAINVLARPIAAEVVVLDVGVARPIPTRAEARRGVTGGRLVSASVRAGSRDLSVEPALTRDEVSEAIRAGLRLTAGLVDHGIDAIGVGEMGIGNTTAASAITAAMTGVPAAEVTGRGTGVTDAAWAAKVRLIDRALALHRPDRGDPLGVLASVGGLEIAALVGVVIGGAARRVPVVLDGFITGSAALVAVALSDRLRGRLIAGHRSVEPGHRVVLDRLGLRPLLELDLRLGEGTGAALAIGLVQAAVRVRDEMATFESAGVSGPA